MSEEGRWMYNVRKTNFLRIDPTSQEPHMFTVPTKNLQILEGTFYALSHLIISSLYFQYVNPPWRSWQFRTRQDIPAQHKCCNKSSVVFTADYLTRTIVPDAVEKLASVFRDRTSHDLPSFVLMIPPGTKNSKGVEIKSTHEIDFNPAEHK